MTRSTYHIAIVVASLLAVAIVVPVYSSVRNSSDDSGTRFRSWCQDSCTRLIEQLDLSCNDHRIQCRGSYEFKFDSTLLIIAKHITLVVSDVTAYEAIPDVKMVLGVLGDNGWPVGFGDTVSYILSTIYQPSPIPELQYEVYQRVQELSVKNSAFIIEHDIVRARLSDTRVIDRKP